MHGGDLYAANGSPVGEIYRCIGDGNWAAVGGPPEPGRPARALAPSWARTRYVGTGTHSNLAKVWRWDGTHAMAALVDHHDRVQ